ncbi:uncharacterized protein N7529_012113 [Penicillium soppii]|uniref:uncharacterized protein n=1 Tax=Penicillium soppii TaxID=69789 RepID=UPI002546B282|nr:uncharacterized protein N7529_012113 [Penicillium soppii]KAJ5852728.1 hypothetical protein N7529_012113 [Penicillium soppii]
MSTLATIHEASTVESHVFRSIKIRNNRSLVGKFQSLCDFDGEFFKLLALPLSNKEHVAKGNGLDPQALL